MIEGWFATPIYSEDMGTEEISAEIDAHLAQKPMQSAKTMWQDDIDTTFSYDGDVNPNALMDECPAFHKAVMDNAYEFLKAFNTLKDTTLECQDSWANRSLRGQYQNFHEHGSHHISGVYYHKSTGEPEQGIISFKAPALVMAASPLMQFQQNRVSYLPIQGRVIMFPSFLLHSVMANETDSPRISCSFNIRLRNKLL